MDIQVLMDICLEEGAARAAVIEVAQIPFDKGCGPTAPPTPAAATAKTGPVRRGWANRTRSSPVRGNIDTPWSSKRWDRWRIPLILREWRRPAGALGKRRNAFAAGWQTKYQDTFFSQRAAVPSARSALKWKTSPAVFRTRLYPLWRLTACRCPGWRQPAACPITTAPTPSPTSGRFYFIDFWKRADGLFQSVSSFIAAALCYSSHRTIRPCSLVRFISISR